MKYSRLAYLSLLAIGSFACGSPPDHTGGKGGSGDTGGDSGDTGGASGGTGGKGTGGKTGGTGGGGGGTGGMTAPPDAGPDGGGTMAECPPGDTTLLCKPTGAFPKTIKETGFFPAGADMSKRPARMIEYSPDPALWSDGMEKARYIVLPKDGKIDNTKRDAWEFPDGTIFIKTFSDDSGTGGKPRAIETRFIRKGGGLPYEFYLYKWKADGSDADLLVDDQSGDINADENVPVTIKHMEGTQMLMVNGGMPFMHTLPSRNACGQCHEENGMKTQTFIGFDEWRLNSMLNGKNQLAEFEAAGVFMKPLVKPALTITDPDLRLQRIKRFVFGNCVHCHAGNVVDLHPDVFVANTVSKPTNAQSVMPPPGWFRVTPGSPTTSVLYVQAQRTMIPTMVGGKMVRMRPMPPVGVADIAANQEFLADLAAWITALKK
ncbi:MAG TPA: hypothetical protein VN914_06115 [Polyangia bacterium]|nr:hypothetical protein [Polyangia bacterium]